VRVQHFLTSVLGELEHWGAARDWVGPDPYEGLNSPLGPLARSRRPRQAVIQAYKRLPFSPPWPLGVKPLPNSKAQALALSAYSQPAGRDLPGSDEFGSRLPARLAGMNLLGEPAAWGYHFDAQTRHLFYPRDTPNAIATCFVVAAFCDAFEATGESGHAELALRARPFLLSLLQESPGYGRFFGYVPSGSQLIHNANLLVCGTLARLHRLDPDDESERAAREAATTTVSSQHTTGLWPYGEAENLKWVDNFHTAYTLEGLCRLEAAFGIGADALERGFRAWRERFLEPDGWARYYPDRHFPLEPHCCASAIDLLLLLASQQTERWDGDQLISLAARIADSAIRELWLPRLGRFGSRRTARGLNKREFMRWTNAPMFRALASLCSADAVKHGDSVRRIGISAAGEP
jgi:polysaccharide biosynthesis protein VpsJ